MRIAELWRYPIKSLAGERLGHAEIRTDGIAGDRIVHVEDARAHVVTARTKPRLLGLHGTTGPAGEPLVDGRHWQAPESAEAIRGAAGSDARLVRWEGPERFDILPLLVATDGAILALGEDGRRLRPNIVIGGVEGLAERDWPGRRLRLGEVVIEAAQLRGRCVMTTYHPDTQAQDPSVLRKIVREFDGRIALDCAVIRPGCIQVGDTAELL
jgi:MOSC domain-containing protein